MEKIKTRLRRFYFRIKHDYLSFDNIIFFVAIIACFFWTYSSLSATARNWELSQQLTVRKKELAARSKLNKMFEGEHLVYLPENSETAKNKYKTEKDDTEPAEPSNLSQWFSFLFGV